jgi:hypothetical protein
MWQVKRFNYAGGSHPGAERIAIFSDRDELHGYDVEQRGWRTFSFDKRSNQSDLHTFVYEHSKYGEDSNRDWYQQYRQSPGLDATLSCDPDALIVWSTEKEKDQDSIWYEPETVIDWDHPTKEQVRTAISFLEALTEKMREREESFV